MDLSNIEAEDFVDLAEQILNCHLLSIYNPNKKEWFNYQFYEIEFYLNSSRHPDPFVHKDKQQLSNSEWYFHKAKANGENYKGGTFKGLDFTFGAEGKYGGILIRAIYNLSENEVIEGPCNTVNHILKMTSAETIIDLVDKMNNLKIFENNYLKIIPHKNKLSQEVYASRRVGLKEEKDPNFARAEYRFLTNPSKIKKDRVGIKKGMKEFHYLTDEEITKIFKKI